MSLTKNDQPDPRERILQTAMRLFYRNGIRASGVDRIIAEAEVAKLTFYRQFPSKRELILAFLERRDREWLAWWRDALQRHGGGPQAIIGALREWFTSDTFRGCAFLNSVAELGEEVPEIRSITRRHKQEMEHVIATVLPPPISQEQFVVTGLGLLIDGAIERAQYDDKEVVLAAVERFISVLLPKSE